MKKNKFKKKAKDSRYSKLSLFQKPDIKFFKPCPLSGKVLSSLVKKISRDVKISNINSVEDIKND